MYSKFFFRGSAKARAGVFPYGNRVEGGGEGGGGLNQRHIAS